VQDVAHITRDVVNVPSKLYACTRDEHTQENLERTQNVPSKNIFAYISDMSFQVQMSPGEMLHKRNVMRTPSLKN